MISKPIQFDSQLIDREGKATPYFQRLLVELFQVVATDVSVDGLALRPILPLTAPPPPDQSGAAGASLVPVYPMVHPPTPRIPPTMLEVESVGYWVPVTDATDPADPAILIDSFGQIVMMFVPTP